MAEDIFQGVRRALVLLEDRVPDKSVDIHFLLPAGQQAAELPPELPDAVRVEAEAAGSEKCSNSFFFSEKPDFFPLAAEILPGGEFIGRAIFPVKVEIVDRGARLDKPLGAGPILILKELDADALREVRPVHRVIDIHRDPAGHVHSAAQVTVLIVLCVAHHIGVDAPLVVPGARLQVKIRHAEHGVDHRVDCRGFPRLIHARHQGGTVDPEPGAGIDRPVGDEDIPDQPCPRPCALSCRFRRP